MWREACAFYLAVHGKSDLRVKSAGPFWDLSLIRLSPGIQGCFCVAGCVGFELCCDPAAGPGIDCADLCLCFVFSYFRFFCCLHFFWICSCSFDFFNIVYLHFSLNLSLIDLTLSDRTGVAAGRGRTKDGAVAGAGIHDPPDPDSHALQIINFHVFLQGFLHFYVFHTISYNF